MGSTRVVRRVSAPPLQVYAALVDPGLVARWKVPAAMSAVVHEFDPREGGRLRVSLTYDDDGAVGKSSAHTDTYSGRFVRLVPGELVVEVDEFESPDPALRGEMTSTVRLTPVDGGTEIEAVHEGLPAGVPAEQNERGWRESLDRLAALVEGRP